MVSGFSSWGVRVNESRDDHDFYKRTNELARSLDDSRQTGGVRYRYDSEMLEDVFTMNDFQIPLRPPNRPLYLNTEFRGHMYPTKRNDNVERITEHTMRHAGDDRELPGDGIDAMRVVMRVTDEFGGARPFATGAISFSISGPGEIVGDNPFSLFGGVGAVWIKTRQTAGTIRLVATHPTLGSKSVEIRVTRAPAILI